MKAIEKVFGKDVKDHLLMTFKDANMLFPGIEGRINQSSFGYKGKRYNLPRRKRYY